MALPDKASSPVTPRILDQVRDQIRVRHYSLRTEEAYVNWIKRFILFHGKRHPRQMGGPEVAMFLSNLAVDRNVSANTQNLALAATLFLYRTVLEIIRRGQRNGIFRPTPASGPCSFHWKPGRSAGATPRSPVTPQP